MKIIFYSEECEYCKKMLAYLDKYNIRNVFKLIDINSNINEIPKNIDIVPTIIDTELNQPLKGKQAFEYLINIRYFNNPTNNISYIESIQKPNICEDKMANNILVEQMLTLNNENQIDSKQLVQEMNQFFNDNETVKFYEKNKDNNIGKQSNEMIKERTNQDSKLSVLLKLRRK